MTIPSSHPQSILAALDAPIDDAATWRAEPSTLAAAPPWAAAEVPPAPAGESRLLTVAEAAEVVPLSAKQLYRVAARPDSPFHKVEGRLMVYEAELHRWIRKHGTGGEPSTPPAAGGGLADRVRRRREGSAS